MEKGTEEHPELEPQVYYLASRFQTKAEAAVPYYAAQETVRLPDSELSAYRFMRQSPETNDKPWYVVVVGLTPTEATQQRLRRALSLGEMTTIPPEVVEMLIIRHITETATKGPWVESHYGENGIRMTGIKFSRRPGGKRHKRRRH
jgi:hypothetical protein